MSKKIYKVPVTWMMAGVYYIRANSKTEAINTAYGDVGDLPKGEYIDDSFNVDENENVTVVGYVDPSKVIESEEPESDEDSDEDKTILYYAFKKLNEGGIVAKENFSCCTTCGCAEIADCLGEHDIGWCFYHAQDGERRAAGKSFFLSYGSVNEEDEQTVEVGEKIVAVLSSMGIRTSWNGNSASKIEVLQ